MKHSFKSLTVALIICLLILPSCKWDRGGEDILPVVNKVAQNILNMVNCK